MSEVPARLDAITAQLGTITPGPWLVNDEEQTVRVEHPSGGMWCGEIMFDRSGEGLTDWAQSHRPNAEFIASAPETVAYLLALARKQAAALERVEAMHVMEFIEDGEYSRNRCADCLYEADGREDCPTVEAIRAALGAGDE